MLATSFERGYAVTSGDVEALPLARRNRLGQAFLDLFFREVFEWHEMQTDPNFGNYRIAPAPDARGRDRIVLLDFGAAQAFPDSFMHPLQELIRGAYRNDMDRVMQAARDLRFMREDYPEPVQRSFAEVCAGLAEPLLSPAGDLPAAALNADGDYCWARSDLPKRIAKRAAKAAFSQHFTVPPGNFVFLNRKLIGLYTFISVLDAQFNGGETLEKYIGKK